jgi:hypothetical protein
MSYVDFCILSSIITGVNGHEVDIFGESIHGNPNQIKHVGRQR